MRRVSISVVLGLSVILFACKKEAVIDVIPIGPTRIIDGFNDSTHISQNVIDIESSFDSYFVPDGDASKIYRLNAQLNLVEVIGRPGRGPGELIGSMTLALGSNNMYVCDNEAIKRFELQNNRWEYRDKQQSPPRYRRK